MGNDGQNEVRRITDLLGAEARKMPSLRKLSRQTRREMEKIHRRYSDQEGLEINEDRLYFMENPGRSHRVRQAFPSEEKKFREIAQVSLGASPSREESTILVVVKQLEPGIRIRKAAILTVGREHKLEDPHGIGENESREIYEAWAEREG